MRGLPLLVLAIALVGGCDMRLPESKVYPTTADVSPKLALKYQRAEKGDLAPVEDLVVGTGRVAQATRQMTFHFEVTTQDGAAIAEGDAQVLIPRLQTLGFPGGALRGDYNSGYLPEWVAGSIMGMQEGGKRRITFNPPVPTAPARALPSPRRRIGRTPSRPMPTPSSTVAAVRWCCACRPTSRSTSWPRSSACADRTSPPGSSPR